MKKNQLIFSVIVLLAMINLKVNAQTEEGKEELGVWNNKPWPISKFSAKVGGFWAISSTELGAGVNDYPYTVVDFEKDLGMNSNTISLLVNLNARFGKRNRVDFSYYNIDRSTSATLNQDIQFGEHIFLTGTSVSAFLKTNIFRLSYGYAFVSNPKLEIGGIFGFHVMAFDVGVDANGVSSQTTVDDNVKFTVPLPDLGVWSTFAFHRNWAVSAELSYFYVNVKDWDLDGRLLSGNVALQYRLGKHWNAELGYTVFGVRSDLDREALIGEFDWIYSGPTLGVAFRFGN